MLLMGESCILSDECVIGWVGHMMSAAEFHPSLEGEARLLLLVEAFSRGRKVLEGRTKLAKLDFLLRYRATMLGPFKSGARNWQTPQTDRNPTWNLAWCDTDSDHGIRLTTRCSGG